MDLVSLRLARLSWDSLMSAGDFLVRWWTIGSGYGTEEEDEVSLRGWSPSLSKEDS